MRDRAILLAISLAVVVGSFAPFDMSAVAGDPLPPTPLLQDLTRQGWLRLNVVSGRIRMTTLRRTNSTRTTTSGEVTERYEIRTAFGDPSISYHLKDPRQQLAIQITASGGLEIRRLPQGGSSIIPIQFNHREGRPLRLIVGGEENQDIHEAKSLWHLLLVYEDPCTEHLLPLLELLRPDWNLGTMANDIREELLRLAETDRPLDQARWTALVKQLGDDQFSKREAAERRLREGGRAVLPFLLQLDRSRLDAEQNFRIERILRSMASQFADDSPDQVASWLASDARIWFTFLSREDPASRRIAAAQLARILGEPIGFDPDADVQTRTEQLDRLRPRVFRD